ncbi:MAG TPA: ribosome maturation factor RimM [Polyangiaceae bacterium]|nr:ribosome maturation factor RimM [Polyangiaceae bacterium]
MLAPDAWVPLGEVMRPHGVRGELRVRPFNRDSDLLLSLDEVLVRFPEGDAQEVSVDAARRAGDAFLLKLHSVDDRDRAGELRKALVCARRADFPPADPGEFYACDVEGALVVVDGDGDRRELGRVVRVRSYPTTDVLEVDAGDGGRAWEVPLVDAVIGHVDLEANVVTLKNLDGVERA